jgi:hypothetical protein
MGGLVHSSPPFLWNLLSSLQTLGLFENVAAAAAASVVADSCLFF